MSETGSFDRVVCVLVDLSELNGDNLFIDHSEIPSRESVDKPLTLPFSLFGRRLVLRLDFRPERLDGISIADESDPIPQCSVRDRRRKRLDITHVDEAGGVRLKLGVDAVPLAEPFRTVHRLGKPECNTIPLFGY